jgi:hypothetical protein
MNSTKPEIQFSLHIIKGPTTVNTMRTSMTCIRANRGVPPFQGEPIVHKTWVLSLVLYAPDESAASTHQEFSIPIIGQERFEIDFFFDYASSNTVVIHFVR